MMHFDTRRWRKSRRQRYRSGMPQPPLPGETSVASARAPGVTAVLAALGFCLCLALAQPGAAATAHPEGKGELVFGMSAAFSGPDRNLGIEYSRGIMAALAHVNANGGAGGWRLALSLRDDGYKPGAALDNTIAFVERENVFALLGYVGTPTTARILPLLKRYAARGVTLFFPLTGADLLRGPQSSCCVFNLRPSYLDETRALVTALLDAGRRRIAVFHQADVYGRNGWDGVRRELAAHRLGIVSEAAYRRGAAFTQDFRREAALIRAGNPDAVIVVGTAPPSAAFIRDARSAGLDALFCALSFSDADAIVQLLEVQGRADGRDYAGGLVFSQVTPGYGNLSVPAVRLYRRLMDETDPHPPTRLVAGGYQWGRYSTIGLEGFLAGLVLGEAVKRAAAAGRPTRAGLRAAMAGLREMDLGLGERVDFAGGAGLRRVHLSVFRNGRFEDVDSLKGIAP
jgi:ABC-type branched-subunit amino acid transport system substrate-binding protein